MEQRASGGAATADTIITVSWRPVGPPSRPGVRAVATPPSIDAKQTPDLCFMSVLSIDPGNVSKDLQGRVPEH